MRTFRFPFCVVLYTRIGYFFDGGSMRRAALIACLLFMICGCASKYGQAHTQVDYYPACYRPIQDLRVKEHAVAETTVGGSILGALGGAVIGFLATGKVEGAVVGGVAGAATGAVAGNIYAKNQKITDENRRMARYLEDIDGDIRNLTITSAAAQTSLKCYDNEFGHLLSDIRARRISRREAEERFDEIASGRDEAIVLLGQAVTYGSDLDAQYERAFLEEEQMMRRRKSKVTNADIKRVRTSKQNLAKQVSAMSKEKKSAEEKSQSNSRDFKARLDEIDA